MSIEFQRIEIKYNIKDTKKKKKRNWEDKNRFFDSKSDSIREIKIFRKEEGKEEEEEGEEDKREKNP